MQRIQKLIADAGYCSRRKAEELILAGKVKVNGVTIKQLGTKAKETDEITVNNILIQKEDEKEYYIFYKPKSVLSTTKDDKGRKTVLDYFDTSKRLYPVGRLDYDTTGLILLTNDGDFANLMMHPSSDIYKTYIVKVKGTLTGNEIRTLKTGVKIDNYTVKADRVKLKTVSKNKESSIVEITIHEGKNHQVKKMFEVISKEVLKLKRETYAFLTLDGLKAGEKRKLTIKEVKTLYALAKKDSLKKDEY